MLTPFETTIEKAYTDKPFTVCDLLDLIDELRNNAILTKFLTEQVKPSERSLISAHFDIDVQVKHLYHEFDPENLNLIQAVLQRTEKLPHVVLKPIIDESLGETVGYHINNEVIRRLEEAGVGVIIDFTESIDGDEYIVPKVTYVTDKFDLET